MNQGKASASAEKGMSYIFWWIFRIFLVLFLPLGWIWIQWRLLSGKEDWGRLRKRFGHASMDSRPAGPLIWLHGASVGEVMGVLSLVEAFLGHRT